MKIREALLCAVGVAFVAAGVFILLRGRADDARLAYGVIAFFGGCTAAGVMQLITPRDRIVFDGAGGASVLPARLRDASLALAGLGMAVGAYLFAPLAASDGQSFIAWVCYFGAAFFGLGAVLGAWRVARPQPTARISANGAQVCGRYGQTLPWREIAAIHVSEMSGWFLITFVSECSVAEEQDADRDFAELSFGARVAKDAFDELHARALALWGAARSPGA